MKNAILIKTDGSIEKVFPHNGKNFTLDELQGFVSGLIQIVPMTKGRELVCNDEGKLIGLPINEVATEIWKKEYPIALYPDNNDELVVGDVLITGKNIDEFLKGGGI